MAINKTNSSRFTGGDHLSLEKDGLYYVAHKALMANELQGGKGAYGIANAEGEGTEAKGNSGPSYGPRQYDLGNNTRARELFTEIAKCATDESGNRIVSNEQLTKIQAHAYKRFNQMTEADKLSYNELKPLMDKALLTDNAHDLLTSDYLNYLNKEVDKVKEAISNITNDVNRDFLNKDITFQALLLDHMNQYSSVEPMLRYFNNNETISIDGYSDHKKTVYGKHHTNYPKDIDRRIENIKDIAPGKKRDISTYEPLGQDKVAQIEKSINLKLTEIDKLNDQLKDYDPIRDIGEIAKTEADIRQAHDEIAQLELNKNSHIDQAIAKKEVEIDTVKESITTLKTDNPITEADESATSGAIPSQEAALTLQITTLENEINALKDRRDSGYEQQADSLKEKNDELQENINHYDKNYIDPLIDLQTKIDNNADTTFNSVQDELKAAGVDVVTPSGLTAEEFANLNFLNPKNGDEAKATQQYLYDLDKERYFPGKSESEAVDGKWGDGSNKAVQQFLYDQDPKYFPDPKKEGEVLTVDKAVDGKFGTGSKNALESFNQKQNDYLASLTAEDLSKLVEAEKTQQTDKKPTAIEALEADIETNKIQIAQLEKSAEELSTRQHEFLDKGIEQRTDAIKVNDNVIEKLDPKIMASDHKNAYDHVKNDLAKPLEVKNEAGNITKVPQPSSLLTEAEKALFNKESIDLNDKEAVKALQQVFCDRGDLTAGEVKGSFGPKTQGLLKDALGLDANATIDKDTPLASADLIKVAEKRLNDLTPEVLSEKITTLKTSLEAEKNQLEQQKNALQDRGAEGIEKAPEPTQETATPQIFKNPLLNKLIETMHDPEALMKAVMDVTNSPSGQALIQRGIDQAMREREQAQQLEQQQELENQSRTRGPDMGR